MTTTSVSTLETPIVAGLGWTSTVNWLAGQNLLSERHHVRDIHVAIDIIVHNMSDLMIA